MSMEQFNYNSTFSIKITEPITNLQFINTHTHIHTHRNLLYIMQNLMKTKQPNCLKNISNSKINETHLKKKKKKKANKFPGKAVFCFKFSRETNRK